MYSVIEFLLTIVELALCDICSTLKATSTKNISN